MGLYRERLSNSHEEIVTNWSTHSMCLFAEKEWVSPKDIQHAKRYELGDCLRVWCLHNSDWCESSDARNCPIRCDHDKF